MNRFDRFYTHDLIINVHEDMPTLEPKYIRALMYALADREVGMATMACPLTEDELINPQLVKISANWNEARKVYVLKNSKVGTVKNFYRFPNLSLDQTLYRHIPIYALSLIHI